LEFIIQKILDMKFKKIMMDAWMSQRLRRATFRSVSNLSETQEEHLMRGMKKALLPLLLVVFSFGSGIVAAAQCDPYIISPSRGVCYLCGEDAFYCYYCCDSET
jgi:hypothetical protein